MVPCLQYCDILVFDTDSEHGSYLVLSNNNLRHALCICPLYPLKRRDVQRRNFACRRSRPCAGPLLGLLSTEVIVVNKINILFRFSNVKKLAINSFGLWVVSHAVDSARPRSGQEHGAAGLRTFTDSSPLCGQSPRRSTQRDRYGAGAFKPKPSVAKFWLVCLIYNFSFPIYILKLLCSIPPWQILCISFCGY